MAQAARDQNTIPTLLGVSNADGTTPVTIYADPTTHRLLVSFTGAGSGTVTDVSVVSANGFAGTVATSTTTPAITLSTTITGLLKGDGTAISAASAATDYAALAFKTIAVSGQSDVVADSPVDTLTLVGSGVTITTNAATDTITFTATSASNITVGTSTITSGTNTRILYDNSGVLGEYTITGSGTVVAMQTAPSFLTSITTPAVLATANDSGALGASGTAFADLFLASGGVINWSAADATITHSAGLLTTNVPLTVTGVTTASGFAPTANTATGNRVYLPAANTLGFAINGSGEVQIDSAATSPITNDGNALGTAALSWSDLFLASGALINIANGNWVATHTSGILTVTTGDLRVTSANVGTNADSVPTLSSTSTLTSKTLTSPTIQTTPVLATGTNFKFTVPTGDTTGTGVITNEFNSGYSSTAIGELVYLDSSATWQKADADASAATYSSMLGIALSVTASGAAATVLLQGFVYAASQFPTFTIGAPVYMSATAAAVTNTAPVTTDSATRIVGYGVHADKMWFNPSNDWVTHT